MIPVHSHAAGVTDTTLLQAAKLGPNNPMVKYHRTSVLVSLGRCEEALVELDLLKKLAPREPSVYFLLANVYSKVRALDTG